LFPQKERQPNPRGRKCKTGKTGGREEEELRQKYSHGPADVAGPRQLKKVLEKIHNTRIDYNG